MFNSLRAQILGLALYARGVELVRDSLRGRLVLCRQRFGSPLDESRQELQSIATAAPSTAYLDSKGSYV